MASYEGTDNKRDSGNSATLLLDNAGEDDEIRDLFKYWDARPDPGTLRLNPVQVRLDQHSNCHRCGKKVYPVERIDIGVLYHKGCFKCRVCSRQLTLRTFQRGVDVKESLVKEIYCQVHVPRMAKGHIDAETAGIRAAINAQKRASHKVHRQTFPDHHYLKDYTYNRPGSGDWSSSDGEEDHLLVDDRGEGDASRPIGVVLPETLREAARGLDGSGSAVRSDTWRQDAPESSVGVGPLPVPAPAGVTPASPTPKTPPWTDEETPPPGVPPPGGVPPLGESGFTALRPKAEVRKRNSSIQRRSTLKSFQDFEKFGVFDAQSMLEKIHRQEEDELYRQIYDERSAIVRQVEEALRHEREKSVRDLIAFFEKNHVPAVEKQTALIKVEEYYGRRREAALRTLLAKLAAEEQAAVARMVEKHSNEMIHLIREKDRLASISSGSSFGTRKKPSTSSQGRDDADVTELPPVSGQSEAAYHATSDVHAATPISEAVDEDGDEQNDESLLDVSAIPEAEPPECPKNRLYTTPDVFKEQDKQAIEESKKEHKTFTDLVRQLSKRCQTELQKVRAIFRWVTVKDLNRMSFGNIVEPDSPLGLLRGIKMGTESYHDLFRRLCSYAGLHCEVVEGYSKGAGYRPGSPITGPVFRNQWTAVWVDGSWRFINCKWGARHVKGTRDVSLTYKCDEFYFLTDPEEHIYQHYPDHPSWQLLPDPVSVEEFTRFPVVKSPFFNNGLSFVRGYDAMLEVQDGVVEIRLQSPRMLGITAKLKSNNKDIPSEILQERAYVRYVDNEIAITVNLPSPGIYSLDIYVSSDWDSERMDSACAFQIHCTGISRDANVTFPQLGSFGRTPAFLECGMCEETHSDPFVGQSGGLLTISFSLTKKVSLRSTLRRWDPRDRSMSDFDKYSLLRHRSSYMASFDIQLPRRGMFVFSVYVTNPDDPSTPMICVYRYLLECRSPKLDALPYPKTSKRYKHCLLIEPLTGELSPDSDVTFRLESKKAVEMMVVIDRTSHDLKQSGRFWQGSVPINTHKGKVIVYARFDSSSDKYIPLLEYVVNPRKKYSYVS